MAQPHDQPARAGARDAARSRQRHKATACVGGVVALVVAPGLGAEETRHQVWVWRWSRRFWLAQVRELVLESYDLAHELCEFRSGCLGAPSLPEHKPDTRLKNPARLSLELARLWGFARSVVFLVRHGCGLQPPTLNAARGLA